MRRRTVHIDKSDGLDFGVIWAHRWLDGSTSLMLEEFGWGTEVLTLQLEVFGVMVAVGAMVAGHHR